jgi:hypothetical protein
MAQKIHKCNRLLDVSLDPADVNVRNNLEILLKEGHQKTAAMPDGTETTG